MMLGPFNFGPNSIKHYNTLDHRLQDILDKAIKKVDFSITCGHRNEETQNRLFNEGFSNVEWPDSKHNKKPSLAVDIAPYPVNWGNHPLVRARFYFLMGIIYSEADHLGIDLRFGLDWSGDHIFTDQNFHDLPHTELVN